MITDEELRLHLGELTPREAQVARSAILWYSTRNAVLPSTPLELIRNAIRTPDGTVLESIHRHDYKTHTDANGKTYMVDGGLDYIRRACHGDEVNLCLNDDQPHEVQRDVLTWGTHGKDGDQPYKRIKIADMETEHIEAVLDEGYPRKVIKNCMEKELEARK